MPAPIQLEHLHVVLVAARNPLNIGAAARAMSNFGFAQLRVVNPYHVAFREARSAVGAAPVLSNAREYEGIAAAIADCRLVVGTTTGRRRELQQPLKRLEHGARLIRRQLKSGKVALLFGSEKFGLSSADLDHCHWLMRIPTCEQSPSMNLGQAVAVCLHELVRDSKAAGQTAKTAGATVGELERMAEMLFEVLRVSRYLKPGAVPATVARIRRMVRRMQLSSPDTSEWLGMLRQILWKLRAREPRE